jgi:hypothetical protein
MIKEKLLEKAEEVFWDHHQILTGQGLSRNELRKLERAGIIKKRMTKNKAGTLIYLWEKT